jgi:hypothetical protein
MLANRRGASPSTSTRSWLAKWLPRWLIGGTAKTSEEQRAELEEQRAYWRQVYPLAAENTHDAFGTTEQAKTNLLLFKTAPRELRPQPWCEQHSFQFCRLDAYFERMVEPPKIGKGELFAPFRQPPGTCLRNMFTWPTGSRADWEKAYPFAAGAPDDSWLEVSHTRDLISGSWMYLSKGSGVFWNCGKSLRARNKVEAALRLLEQISSQLPPDKVRGSAAETLAQAISSNDDGTCDGDHCTLFMRMMSSNRTDRNENCFGMCSLQEAPLAVWLQRVADGAPTSRWQWDHMSVSSVFDKVIGLLASHLQYDSVQLTVQPQVWCGLAWTTEVVDLRVRKHKPMDIVAHLSLRDPLATSVAASAGPLGDGVSRAAPCVVRPDNQSKAAFNLVTFCEGV